MNVLYKTINALSVLIRHPLLLFRCKAAKEIIWCDHAISKTSLSPVCPGLLRTCMFTKNIRFRYPLQKISLHSALAYDQRRGSVSGNGR